MNRANIASVCIAGFAPPWGEDAPQCIRWSSLEA